MMTLALDLATRTGWATGRFGMPPSWGAVEFGRGRSNGEVLAAYRGWLNGQITALEPQIIAFESPFVPTGNSEFAKPRNALTVRRLFGFAAVTELTCIERRLRCYEARPTEISRRFLGGPVPKKRDEKKAATVAMARQLGFAVDNDDEADAVALWCFAESVFEPRMVSRRRAGAGLELALS